MFIKGININLIHGTIKKFNCQSSNDANNWDLLYTSPKLTYHIFEESGRSFSTDFGLSLRSGVDP